MQAVAAVVKQVILIAYASKPAEFLIVGPTTYPTHEGATAQRRYSSVVPCRITMSSMRTTVGGSQFEL